MCTQIDFISHGIVEVSPWYFVSGKARGGSRLYAHLYFAHQKELSKFIWSAWAQDCMKWSPQVCLPSQFEFPELKKARTRPFTKPQEIGMIWLIICVAQWPDCYLFTSRKPVRCAGNFDVVFIYLLFIDKWKKK